MKMKTLSESYPQELYESDSKNFSNLSPDLCNATTALRENKDTDVLGIVKRDGVSIYKELASVPLIAGASVESVENNLISIRSKWSQRDINTLKKTSFERNSLIQAESLTLVNETSASPSESSTISCKQGDKTIRILDVKHGTEEVQVLQVWTKQKCQQTWKISQEKHGKVYGADDQFGSVDIHQDGSHVLYIAEQKTQKPSSFFSTTKEESKQTDESTGGSSVGDENLWRDVWGEQLGKKHKPVLCVAKLTDATTEMEVTVVTCDEDVSIGQAVWSPTGHEVVFVGWYNEPYRLGAIYCLMRRSALFSWKLGAKPVRLTGSEMSVRSPRFTPDGSSVIYLRNQAGGPHWQCSQLCSMKLSSREVEVIVDIVSTPGQDGFVGLYSGSLPRRCWSLNRFVLLDSASRSKHAVYAVDVSTKEIHKFGDDLPGSMSVLDVQGDLILASYSSLVLPPVLLLGRMEVSGSEPVVNWKCATSYIDPPTCLSGMTYKVLKHLPNNNDTEDMDFESIVIWKKSRAGVEKPTLLYPHGGPHSVFSTSYVHQFVELAAAGFIVQIVNYRGSIGFGQSSIDSLPGKIGTNDVHDCFKALSDLQCAHLGAGPVPDKSRAFVCGGSHGGFLTAHLSAQYPKTFKAACCRNPVIHLPSMFGVSDIPDWICVENGSPYSHSLIPSNQDYDKMLKCSPTAHIDQIETPVMVMIGGEDRRVPPSQGIFLYKQLLARGVDTKLLYYPEDCHPLVSIDTEADCFLNILAWFLKFL